MKKKQDARVLQTQQKLSEALTELLQVKQLNEITVTDLVTSAKINRSTFYLRYASLQDFFVELETTIYGELRKQLMNYFDQDTGWLDQFMNPHKQVELPILNYILQFLYDNSQMQAFVKARRYNSEFLLNIVEDGYSSAFSIAEKNLPQLDQEKFKYVYSFVAMGSIGLIFNWIQNDMKESVDQITDLVHKFVLQTIRIDIS